jgi:phosphatidylinositol-3-phosphatase
MNSRPVCCSLLFAVTVIALHSNMSRQLGRSNSASRDLPSYDHVVVVIEENKSYEQVIGSPSAPYINQVLRAEGANLTRMYAEEHESEGNYFWLFSGSNQGVGFVDVIPGWWNSRTYPFQASNLAQQLIEKGRSFRGYSEGLPEPGSTVGKTGHYARKHVPWVSFANIPHGTDPDSSTNLPFTAFPSDFSRLPTVAFVVPDLINDMHDPANEPAVALKNGDEWLRKNIDPYYQWAKKHNSLLIVTFDESDNPRGHVGYTDPGSPEVDQQNRIPTIIAGARISRGDYTEGKGVTHVNLLRTIEAMYGLWASGDQAPNALKYGITSEYFIQDTFTK